MLPPTAAFPTAVGTPALHLSPETDTAIRDYRQLSPLMPPGARVAYAVLVAPVVDFRTGFDAAHRSPPWAELHRPWRELKFDQRVEPPSWVLADEVSAAGAKGVLFRSVVAPGGINLVVYAQALAAGDRLDVHDPGGLLPKNQDSWR